MKQIKLHLFKTLFLLVLIGSIFTSNTLAQGVEVTPFYGYMFAGKVTGYYGDLNIRDASMYGLMLDINVQKGMQVELYYSRTDTRADFVEYRGSTYKLTDMSVNYIQLGFLRTVQKMKNIEDFNNAWNSEQSSNLTPKHKSGGFFKSWSVTGK